MDRADIEHLARMSELACADDPDAYRRSVRWFVSLGYAWVMVCLLIGAILLASFAGVLLGGGQFRGYMIGWLLIGGGLLWASLSSLWLRLEPPEGQSVSPEQAPALFRALEKIRQKIKGPVIDRVLVNDEFNASIVQIPRWGLLGGSRNYLVIGLPLLFALDPSRVAAVLAHEYGHLRGGHGSFGAWVYRSRMAWQRLYEKLSDRQDIVSFINHCFMNWYFPRFIARSFALARQDEYEADRVSGRLLGKDTAAAALKEIAVKGDWLDAEFWAAHWQRALHEPNPVGPMQTMQRALLMQPEPEFARRSLHQAWKQTSGVDDTHPVLRERLEALDEEAKADRQSPAWSRQSGLALLGGAARPLMAHFDKQWCQDNAQSWKEHHADLLRAAARAEALRASMGRNSAAECTELADLMLRLDPKADAKPVLEQALARTGDHPEALRGLARLSAERDPVQSLAWAQRLHDASQAHRYWAARHAVAVLEDDAQSDLSALKLWRERLRVAQEAEERVWEELTQGEWLAHTAAPDLSDFERDECESFLRRQPHVQRAWIARKVLKEFAWRRCYVLVVELSGMGDDEAHGYTRWLMQRIPTPGVCLVSATQLGVDVSKAPRGTLTLLHNTGSPS